MEGSEGFPRPTPDPQGTQATNAGLLSDNVVSQPWNRSTRGMSSATIIIHFICNICVKLIEIQVKFIFAASTLIFNWTR